MRKQVLILSMIAFGSVMCSRLPISAEAQRSSELVFQGRARPWPPRELRPVALPDGRLILSVADTVYMLDSNGKQLWRYQNETLRSEPAFNALENEVAVIMYDLQAVRLDASTGAVKWKSDSVGRAAFVSVSPYDKGFLVLMDMSGYRDQEDSKTPDRIEYWGESKKDSWYIAVPPHSELVVHGKRIYALTRGAQEVRLRELHAPEVKMSPSK